MLSPPSQRALASAPLRSFYVFSCDRCPRNAGSFQAKVMFIQAIAVHTFIILDYQPQTSDYKESVSVLKPVSRRSRWDSHNIKALGSKVIALILVSATGSRLATLLILQMRKNVLTLFTMHSQTPRGLTIDPESMVRLAVYDNHGKRSSTLNHSTKIQHPQRAEIC